MTDHESLNPVRQDMVTHHIRDDRIAGEGERGYAEHVSSQKLSAFERFIVIGALVLLSFAGVAAHIGGNTDPMTTSAIASPAAAGEPQHDTYGHCREHSPYPDKSC
jgi:hypothetical protein